MESYDGQGFPFSPLLCRQGRTRMGGGVEQWCTLHAVIMLGFWH
jgi:hypothetical protein